MQSDVDNAPVVRFLDKVLRDAVTRGAERVKFERYPRVDTKLVRTVEGGLDSTEIRMTPRPRGQDDTFHIEMEFGGVFEETAVPPVVLWERIIRMLKVLARIVDYGPNKSDEGQVCVNIDRSGDVIFRLTSNPDPDVDSIVMLERLREPQG